MYFLNRYIVHIIAIVMLLCSANIKWGGKHWKNTILADGKGYYAYLPAVFIYHDLTFSFIDDIEQKYYDENTRVDFRTYIDGKAYSKYPMGVALLLSPFFLVAHLLSLLLDYTSDGYSRLYNIAVCVGALFYLLTGLTYLKKLLALYKTEANIKTLVVIAFAFGTNLFYYTIVEPAMSHVYSFALITMFLYYGKIYFKTTMYKYLFRLSLLLGFVVLIRPVNLLIIAALPFIAGNLNVFKQVSFTTAGSFKNILTILVFPVFFMSVQWVFYYIQTGEVLFDPYIGEAFYFSSPQFIPILFSYKKGLFLYMPLLLFSMLGIIYLYKRSKWEAATFIVFFVLLTYILSSWWCWYYGGSFGLRAYIEYYALFGIALASLLTGIKKNIYRRISILVVVLLILFCQLQTYQYRYFHIHWSDMNKEKYWDVFLRVDKLVKK